MSVIINKWNDGSGDSINIESPSFQGNQTVKISSPVQKGTSKRSMQFIGKCKKDSSKQVILTVEQEASVYTYDLILSSDNTEIAAKGGTTNITAVLKTYRNGNLVSTDNVTPVLSGSATGFSISGVTVTASNRTTIVGTERSINVTGKFSNTFDGQTVSANIVIKQEANSQTLREITNRYTSSNPLTGQNTVKANGGTVWVYTFAIYDYTSGDSSETNVSDECTFGNVTFGTWDSAKHTWTCPSAGTTIYSNDRGASIKVTWGSKKTTYYLYQEANSQTLREITNRYTSSNPLTGQNTVKANGGTVWVYTFAIYDYTSGDSSETNVSDECTFGNVTFGTWDSAKHTWTCPSAGTTIYSNDRGASIKVTWGSKKTTYYLYQEKNLESVKSISGGIYTYGNIVAGTISNKTIPASGGSATATAGNGSQTWNKSATITTYEYTSGATKDVTTEAASSGTANVVPNVSSITATASSKGITVSAQTTVKSQAVTWSANGKSASETMYIYQEANTVIDDNYDEHLSSYGTPEMVIISNLITAAGGTARAAGVVRNTYIYYDLYTSGSTVPYTRTKAGVYKIEMISNGNNRFSMDDTYLITHSSMGANVTTDTAKFRCYNESDRTKYVDDSISVSNRIESYNYGSWNISISANPTSLPATGGTSTITSSCTRSKTPVYTSGSTGTATTESATSTLALTTNPGGFTLNGNKLTAANNPIGAKTATVTASYSGATSKSVSVSQAAGSDGIGYMQIQGDGTSHPIFRVGGNTGSVEPMSINKTSETASDEDVSIFASIKRFLTKFV